MQVTSAARHTLRRSFPSEHVSVPNLVSPLFTSRPCLLRQPSTCSWRGLNPSSRALHTGGGLKNDRQRLSSFWIPTGGIELEGSAKDSHSLLIKAGFVRQAHAGFFQFLPLGARVQEKVEKLLDKHMTRLGASKLALSTFSSQSLWEQSGRFVDGRNKHPEIFQLRDRKEAKYLLSPTHEEEITRLVGQTVQSYKELPLMLYQITRKYRDEARPRHGLLRMREFVMKDLYTFDLDPEKALASYQRVQEGYAAFFSDLRLPRHHVHRARASSGAMGGELSHEYHLISAKGEDRIMTCDACEDVANIEVAEASYSDQRQIGSKAAGQSPENLLGFVSNVQSEDTWYRQLFVSAKNTKTMIQVVLPTAAGMEVAGFELPEEPEVDIKKLQELFPDLDLDMSSVAEYPNHPGLTENDSAATMIYRVYDGLIVPPLQPQKNSDTNSRPSPSEGKDHTPVLIPPDRPLTFGSHQLQVLEVDQALTGRPRLTQAVSGDICSVCNKGCIFVQPALELGHTFHLGTRYSEPLNATVHTESSHKAPVVQDSKAVSAGSSADASSPSQSQVPLQMGCHGIGVSRLIAAVADVLSGAEGLGWPRVMAPFEVVVISSPKVAAEDAERVYDLLASAKAPLAPIPQQEEQEQEQEKRPSPPPLSQPVDVILDDRYEKSMGWKLKDADLIGYPIIVILGRAWANGEEKCEVQCRRLYVKEEVPLADLEGWVTKLLARY